MNFLTKQYNVLDIKKQMQQIARYIQDVDARTSFENKFPIYGTNSYNIYNLYTSNFNDRVYIKLKNGQEGTPY